MNDNLPLVVANLKANFTWDQFYSWLEQTKEATNAFGGTVIVAPSMAFISEASQKLKEKKAKLKLASQDISQFEQGAFTGEVAASQIADQITYAIIGHSERRNYLNEEQMILEKKVANVKKAAVKTIFCVQDENTRIPYGVDIVAYEPTFAIGTGNADTPENAQAISKKLKTKGEYTVLYGGSVTEENVKSFLKKGVIDGVLVGSASLKSESFSNLLKAIQL